MQVSKENKAVALGVIRQLYLEADSAVGADDEIEVTVSFDGTWHKRDHSTYYGVGVAVEYITVLLIDTEVLSNFCQGCLKSPRPDSALYCA